MVKSYQAEAGYLLRGITLAQGPLQELQKLLASWGEHSVQATRPQDVIISLKLLSLLARVMHTLQCTHNAASDIVGFVLKQTLKLSFSKVGRVHCTVTLHSGFTVSIQLDTELETLFRTDSEGMDVEVPLLAQISPYYLVHPLSRHRDQNFHDVRNLHRKGILHQSFTVKIECAHLQAEQSKRRDCFNPEIGLNISRQVVVKVLQFQALKIASSWSGKPLKCCFQSRVTPEACVTSEIK